MQVCVLASGGKPLMPTNIKRARKLLKKGRAVIAGHHPFTIRLLDREDGDVQPVEFKMDAGDHHIGISVCSEKQELFAAQYDLLTDEPERHRDRAVNRKNRRNRKKHRKPRFNNRRKPKGWLAPTLQHKADQHVLLYERYAKVLPITDVVVEMGSFDTQLLAAIQAGNALPQGTGYQQGPSYGYATLREAVFTRDEYTCQVCGKSVRNGAILRMHHIGFRIQDRSNRMDNLLTVCTNCHTSKNHKPGGKLWNLKPAGTSLAAAAHMNAFRWKVWNGIKKAAGPGVTMHMTYGAATKLARKALNIPKSHVNDAYAMGKFHPKKRATREYWQKCRRNNRILEKFYDAKYIDRRDGQVKSGQELSCGRTRRSESRHGSKNLRPERGCRAVKKRRDGTILVSRGRRVIRTQRYDYRPGDIVWTDTGRHTVKGIHNCGKSILFTDGKSCSPNKVKKHVYTGGWRRVG